MNGDKKILSVDITAATIIKIILLLLLFVILFTIRDVLLVVLAAVVIASAIEPGTLFFAKYKIGRLPAVIIIYVATLLCLAGVFYFVLPPFLDELSVYLANLDQYVDKIDLWNPLSETGFLGDSTVQGLSQSFSLKDIFNDLSGLIQNTSGGFIRSITHIFGGAVSFLLIIVLSFYLAVQEDGVSDFLKIISPVRHQKYIINLWKRSQVKIGRWMQGQMLLAILIGVLVYLGLVVLGVENAMLLALLAALFELIPVFGPILAAIPAVVVAYVNSGATTSLLVMGLYLIIQQFENHLIYPLVVKKVVGIPPLVVIIALIIGGKLAGFLGILLSVPIAAAFMEYIDDIKKQRVSEEAALSTKDN